MSLQRWETLARKELLKHPRLHIVEDDVKLPDGKTTQYIRQAPVKTHSAGIIAINDRQEILLQKEYSYPPNKVMWQLPGGGMLENEDTIKAAKRELSEECDLTAGTCQVIGSFYYDNRRSDGKQYIVVCKDLSPLPGQKDAEEFLENHWIPIAQLKSMIQTGEFENVNLLAALNLWLCQNEGDTAVY